MILLYWFWIYGDSKYIDLFSPRGECKNVLVMITSFKYKADIDAQIKHVFFSSLTRRELRVIICQNTALGETNKNITSSLLNEIQKDYTQTLSQPAFGYCHT